MNRLALLLVVCLLVVQPLVVAGATRDPNFRASVPEPTLFPGSEQTVVIELVNDPDNVDNEAITARQVTVEARAGETPFTILSGPRFLDRMVDSERVSVPVRLVVPADTEPGTYEIPLTVDYVFGDGNDEESDTVRATVRVADQPRLRIVDTESDVSVGERGTVSVTVENVGSATASDARLALSAAGTDLSFSGRETASRFLGRLARDDRATVTYTLSADDDARSEQYALTATAAYTDQNGFDVTRDLGAVGVTPQPELQFAIGDVEADLHTGVESTVNGTLTNLGNRTARNVVVTLSSPSTSLRLLEPSVPVGDLEPGETRSFAFPVAVSAAADGGPRPVTVGVEYRLDADTADQRRQRDVQVLSVPVADDDLLSLSAVNATYTPGTEGNLRVRVQNVGDRPLHDVEPRLGASPPFASEVPQAFVESLGPGESATVAFDLSVSPDAVSNTHALPVNVTARTEANRAVRTGPLTVPVTVVDRDLFSVTGVNTTVAPDSETQIRVRVENVGDKPLRDVKPQFGPAPPFTSEAPQTYVESLAPGESAVVTFQVSVAEDAVPSAHSLPVTVVATDADGDTVRDGPHDVAVTIAVEEGAAGSLVVLAVGIVVVAAILGVGYWWLRH
ncbi:COG1361 S-layer family protein [Halomicroarcula sp. GCM10025324]|uniref:COG1361 S-layer family protein n=1 Tax=Haloarcula TaxID=2237 RepID=UPI0023E76DA5|nr:NEW3 domain-containing protein [Halomicroarcula sp. ZS-22-S1]